LLYFTKRGFKPIRFFYDISADVEDDLLGIVSKKEFCHFFGFFCE